MSAYLIKRGKAARSRTARAHLAKYDAHGEIVGAWCGLTNFDVQSNVPWGLKTCKHCLRRSAR